MRRLSAPSIALPLLLAVAGVGLILVGQLDLDARPSPSLPDIPDPSSPVAVVSASPSPTGSGPSDAPTPSLTPVPADWVARQIQIESVGINIAVVQAVLPGQDDFPPHDAAYILRQSSQPGRGTNSYLFAHAELSLFKPLWNVLLGAEVKVLMSDDQVLRYRVTEIHPNVSCPDDRAEAAWKLPLALVYAPPGCAGVWWTQPVDHERLTLQTSQGYNRNWGELVVVAEPIP
ncbi:MAG: sortase [Chloroflexota bacterium]|nr:sortase [Chloroflexota bacterium]